MRNRTLYCGTAAALLVLLAIFSGACSKKEEKAPEPVVPVQAEPVQRGAIHRIIQAQAVLYASDQAAITPKIGAPISKIYVNRGDHVQKGQLLVELESRDLAAAVAEAQGNYDQAAANYKNTTTAALPEEVAKSQSEAQSNKEALDAAQKVYESRKKLVDEGAIPRKQLDEAHVAFVQARSQYDVAEKHLESLRKTGSQTQEAAAKAQVDAAKGRLDAAGAQLQYSKIISPINGVIAERPLYAGEMASGGTTLLTVMDISTVIARASIPVDELRFLKAGDEATIAGDGSIVQGKVSIVSPALDPNSTTAEVWIKALNPGERLRPGSTVQISIVAETIKDALMIPASAILPSQESAGDTVLVVGSDSMAHERKIVAGVREGDKAQILSGLSAGERVITVGGYGLQDKTRVTQEKPGEKE